MPEEPESNAVDATGHGWFVKCATLERPGVGVVHLHARWWRPGRVVDVWLFPPAEGDADPVRVPEGAWSAVAQARSWADALRIIQDAQNPPEAV